MYRVLIADDEPIILEGLKHIIKWDEYGLEIAAEAVDGSQALNMLENQKVHILITDIKMPNMDGLELIKNIRQRQLDIKCIILSGYDDFLYVKEALKLGIENYLLKPLNVNELSSTILNVLEKIEGELRKKIQFKSDSQVIKENILFRWVNNNISHSELLGKASLLNINLNCNRFIVCLLRILRARRNDRGENGNSADDTSLYRSEVYDICSGIFEKYAPITVFGDLSGDMIILFSGNNADYDKAEIKRMLGNCLSTVNKNLNLDVFISVGSCEPDCNSVYKSYKNAGILLEYSLIYPSNTIIDYDEIKQLSTDGQKHIQIDYSLLKNLVLSKNRITAFESVDRIYRELSNNEGIKPVQIQNITLEILYNIFTVVASLKINLYDLPDYPGNLFSEVFQIKSKDELIKIVKSLIEKVINQISLTEENINPLVKRVINHIENNYDKDLSLKSLAEVFNINTAYLGQLFKNVTGEMFSNYLNKIRVKHSKQMLLETNLSAAEIAEKVGYSNANYFYETFRKITGVYPSKFKAGSYL